MHNNNTKHIYPQNIKTLYRTVELRKRMEHVEAMHVYNSSIYT